MDASDEFSSALLPGTVVGPFEIIGVLGVGGMATVYEAYDGRLERSVALKVLPPEFLHDGSFAKRFENEARIVAKLEHPHIVPIYETGIDEGIPWMSMRLFGGGNMGALLVNGRPLLPDAVQMIKDVASALDYAHARGVVHRDIKPTNIFRDSSGRMCVGDFGLAQMLEGDAASRRTRTLVGTPQYMAPEQALSNPTDHRCDVYSLGIVAYEVFVGDVPFSADSAVAVLLKHVNEPVPVPSDELVPPALMRAIQTALAKRPEDRWPSAGAFAAALEAGVNVASGDPARHEVRHSDNPGRSRIGRRSAAGGALLAAAGVVWIVSQSQSTSSRGLSPRAPSPPMFDTVLPAALAAVPPESVAAAPLGAPLTKGAGSRPAPVAAQPRQELPTQAIESTLPLFPVKIGPTQTPVAQPRLPIDTPGVPAETSSTVTTAPSPPATDVVTAPVRIRTVSAEYPSVARAAQLEGDVIVQATVGRDGKVSDVEVLQTVHPLLDEAAKKAVRQYEYAPGRRDGIPEPAVLRITVSFRLR